MNKRTVEDETPTKINPVVSDHSFSWFSNRVLMRGQLSLAKSRRRSFLYGLTGLLFLFCGAVAIFTFVAVKFEDWFGDVPRPDVMALTVCSIYAVLASTLSVVSFVPLMGASRLTLRFIIAVSVHLVAFMILIAVVLIVGAPDLEWDDIPDAGQMIVVFVFGVSAVTIPLQIWSSVSIRPLPSDLDPPSRTSIGDLMELMLVVAFAIAFWRFLAPDESMALTLWITGGIGICFGIQLVPLFLGYFTRRARWRLLSLAYALTFLVGATCVWLLLAEEAGTINFIHAVATTVIGGILAASIYVAIGLTSFWWLRGCGWSVASRTAVHPAENLSSITANLSAD
ncbi:MAG: hypothetical protein KDB00_24985 [Planctomycetales bacterium]|nr:hypothetical protein [Planctomycetales bacterium]